MLLPAMLLRLRQYRNAARSAKSRTTTATVTPAIIGPGFEAVCFCFLLWGSPKLHKCQQIKVSWNSYLDSWLRVN